MVPLRVSITKFEWLPDDPTAFVPSMLWKLLFITTWDDSQNRSHPTDSAEEAQIEHRLRHRSSFFDSDGRERRPRANSPQESLYLFQSPSMALAISLAAARNQFDFLRPRSLKMSATWRLLPR